MKKRRIIEIIDDDIFTIILRYLSTKHLLKFGCASHNSHRMAKRQFDIEHNEDSLEMKMKFRYSKEKGNMSIFMDIFTFIPLFKCCICYIRLRFVKFTQCSNVWCGKYVCKECENQETLQHDCDYCINPNYFCTFCVQNDVTLNVCKCCDLRVCINCKDDH